MAVIPPWQAVNPLDFIKAMQAGASAGSERAANMLRARQIAQSGGAADNSLGYAQLAQRAQEGAAERAIAEKLAAAKLREAQVQHEALQQYREQQEAGRQRDDLRADQALRGREDYYKQGLGIREGAAQNVDAYRDELLRLSQERNDIDRLRLSQGGSSRFRAALGLDPAVVTPVAPGAGAAATPSALPPPDQLVVGETYDLPFGRGKGVWNGRDFDPPGEVAPVLPRRKPTLYTGDYLNSPDELEMLSEGAGAGFPISVPQP